MLFRIMLWICWRIGRWVCILQLWNHAAFTENEKGGATKIALGSSTTSIKNSTSLRTAIVSADITLRLINYLGKTRVPPTMLSAAGALPLLARCRIGWPQCHLHALALAWHATDDERQVL
jgi:hypothetical protein